jgi:mRNA interferase MazF
MKPRGPRPGDIYLAEFPEHDPQGREQQGIRPALVLAVPTKSRFPVILVAPMTTDRDQPWVRPAPHLYTRLPKGIGGLTTDSILLLDQTRFLDAVRVRRFLGPLEKQQFEAVLGQWLALFKH